MLQQLCIYHVVRVFVSVPLLLHRAQHHQRVVVLEAQLSHVKRDGLLEDVVSLSFRAPVLGTPPARNLFVAQQRQSAARTTGR